MAQLVVSPTNDEDTLIEAVQNLVTARRTAIGTAIINSVNAIAEFNPAVPPSTINPATFVAPAGIPRQPGEYVPDIIVLLTDGANSRGIAPRKAAEVAAERGIRIYTIGFGTERGGEMGCSRQQAGNRLRRMGFGGGGGGFRRGIDEATLQDVAEMTGGLYYSAESAGELQDVFQELPTHLVTVREPREISVVFAAIGALMAVVALGLSVGWSLLP